MNFELSILLLIIFIVLLLHHYKLYYNDMTYVKSDTDETFYLVRNNPNKQEASNLLAKIKKNITTLSNYLYENRNSPENINYKEYIDLLYSKAPHIIIIESTQDSLYTSYCVNKGEQIIFCLRPRYTSNKLYDINLMMYVVLHEISHVACPIYDNHGPLFRKIFAFITRNAININLYKRIPFNDKPINYCGLLITDSII